SDLEKMSDAAFEQAGRFFFELATSLAEQVEIAPLDDAFWPDHLSPGVNFERFLRRSILEAAPEPVVWGLDGVDRLFGCPFSGEVFRLLRSWHNGRALDPAGPWSRLTLAIAYAAEVHLFIRDLNQSPFNVGVRIELADLSREQVAYLN